jgi:predicted SnoaL-like aldol condensation-catalyzing enzyme
MSIAECEQRKALYNYGFMIAIDSTISRRYLVKYNFSLMCVVLIALLISGAQTIKSAHAAGAVEMQVESILQQMIDEYNQAMEAGDASGWMKYFTDNVQRRSPISEQAGKKDVADYFAWEFKNFQAKIVTKKLLVSGRSAALVFVWDAVHKASNAPLKIEMVGIFDMASSGKFDGISFYYDTGKSGKALADATAQAK